MFVWFSKAFPVKRSHIIAPFSFICIAISGFPVIPKLVLASVITSPVSGALFSLFELAAYNGWSPSLAFPIKI